MTARHLSWSHVGEFPDSYADLHPPYKSHRSYKYIYIYTYVYIYIYLFIICFPQKKRNWLNLNSIYQTNLKSLMIFWRFPSKETSSMVVVGRWSKSSQFRPRDPPSDTQSYRNFQKMAPNWPSLHSTSLAGQKPGQHGPAIELVQIGKFPHRMEIDLFQHILSCCLEPAIRWCFSPCEVTIEHPQIQMLPAIRKVGVPSSADIPALMHILSSDEAGLYAGHSISTISISNQKKMIRIE